MEKSSFFNSVSGDRRYSAEDWAAYFSAFVSNGVLASPSNSLQVVAASGMNVTVKAGRGFINGYFYQNTTDLQKTLAVADGVNGRIDRVVLRWSLTDRKITAEILTGTPASTPQAPTLARSNTTYEIALADILVGAGVTAISQANITDKRADSTVCGYVTGAVNQLDFSSLTAQFNAFFTAYELQIASRFSAFENLGQARLELYGENMDVYEENAQADFAAWFASLQNDLDDNTAGNLENQINAVSARAFSVYTHSKSGTVHSLTLSGGGNHMVFKTTAAFTQGDTFKVNGVNVTVLLTGGGEPGPGYFSSGNVIYGYKDGSTLYLSGGNGSFFTQITVSASSGGSSLWTQEQSGGYSQNVSVTGMKANDRPRISFVPPASFSNLPAAQTAFGLVYDCDSLSGALKLFAKEAPSSEFTILAEVVRA